MSVAAKHFYRFDYLKSEHWSNLRLEKLASVDAKCAKCGVRDLSNDIHHFLYRNLYDVKLKDLVVLCRKCHEEVHAYLDKVESGFFSHPNSPNQWEEFLVLWNGNPGAVHGLGPQIVQLRESREAYNDALKGIKTVLVKLSLPRDKIRFLNQAAKKKGLPLAEWLTELAIAEIGKL